MLQPVAAHSSTSEPGRSALVTAAPTPITSARRAFILETLDWIAEKGDVDGLEQIVFAAGGPFGLEDTIATMTEAERSVIGFMPIALSLALGVAYANHIPDEHLGKLLSKVISIKGSIIECELERQDEDLAAALREVA